MRIGSHGAVVRSVDFLPMRDHAGSPVDSTAPRPRLTPQGSCAALARTPSRRLWRCRSPLLLGALLASVLMPASRDSAEPLFRSGRDAGYVEPAACVSCHGEIAATFRQTGMGRSFFKLTPESAAADFSGRKPFYHEASRRYYLPFEREGRYYIRRHQQGPDGGGHVNVVEKEVHYVMGSGNHARGYIHRTPQNRLLQLPLTWYSEQGGFWEMAPGYDQPAHPDFRREIDYECMSCHNGYPEVADDEGARWKSPVYPDRIPEGIDCQRCHGPGREHVAAAGKGVGVEPEALKASIVNPARLPHDRQLEICMQCHLETTSRELPHSIWRYGKGPFSYQPSKTLSEFVLHFDHRPGTSWDDKFEVVNAVYRLRKSTCFTESNGSLTCTICHDPHHAPRREEATRLFSNACLRCHGQKIPSAIKRGDHPATDECVSCHMQKRRPEDAIHTRLTDHLISRRPSPNKTVKRAPYRGEVELYYPSRKPATVQEELYLAVAQVKDRVNLEQGLVRLQSLLRKHKPTRPEFAFELGEGYRAVARWNAAIRSHQESLTQAPNFWPAYRGMGLALIATGDAAAAVDALEHAAKHTPEEPSVLNALGDAYYRAGRLRPAVSALQKARRLHPDLAEPHNNLGVVYSAQGKMTAAQAMFREAIRMRPDYASAHRNLAGLLAPREPASALKHLQEAVRLEPENPQFRFDLGIVSVKAGAVEEGRGHLERVAQSTDARLRKAARAVLKELNGKARQTG